MKLTYDDVEKKLEKLGFVITGHTGNGNLYQIGIQKHSPEGQDCSFTLQCERGNPASAVPALRMINEDFDVNEETRRWIGNDGHWKNGEPYLIEDILKDMKWVEENLARCTDELEEFVKNFEIEYSKEDMKKLFAERLCHINGEESIDRRFSIGLCKQAVESILNENKGSPDQKKKLLDEYLVEIGITSGSQEECFNALNLIQEQTLKNKKLEKIAGQCKNKNLHTTLPSMSSTEVRVHRMFDRLFNDSDTDPVSFAETVLSAGPDRISRKELSENEWWKSSCIHAVNSGGDLWQDTFERIKLMEEYGLIKNTYEDPSLYGPCYDTYKSYMRMYGTEKDTVTLTEFIENIFPNKTDMTEYMQIDEKNLAAYKNFLEDKENHLVDKYNETADRKWGEYMHMYLKDLGVLPYDRKQQVWNKKHEITAGRSDIGVSR